MTAAWSRLSSESEQRCVQHYPTSAKTISHSSQEQITENLNYLFGIALSADDEPSLRIMACHALYACTCLPRHRLWLIPIRFRLSFTNAMFVLQAAHG